MIDNNERVRDDKPAFVALRDLAAQQTGLDPGDVEKDYYATEVLRSVMQPADGVDGVIFKGGTSLQKAYGLIQRFSEDVDLLVLMPDDISSTQKSKRMEDLASRAAKAVDGRSEFVKGGSLWRNERIHYGIGAESRSNFTTPGVLLEMGTCGGPDPNEIRSVSSFMSQAAPDAEEFADLQPFDVVALASERTLTEKLAYLHHRGSVGDLDGLAKGARHLYDVQALLRSEDMHARLDEVSVETLIVDVDARSERFELAYTPRPDAGFADTAALTAGTAAHNALRVGYDTLAPVVWGELPPFDEAIRVVLDNRHRL